MGTLFVLVSPCFKENVVVTCKIRSFLCSLDNLLQKNVIVFFLEIKFQNGAHFKRRAIFDLFFTFFSHQGEVAKIPSGHISFTYEGHSVKSEMRCVSAIAYLLSESWCCLFKAPTFISHTTKEIIS